MRGGFVGVDIFFVISGFLISSIIFSQLESGSFSFWNFYSRRIRRIYPTLITVLLACLGFGWFYLLSDEYAQLGKHVAGGAGFISNFLLWFESGYFDNAADTKPLLHLWSLGIEEQFYIIWPLLLWLAWKKRFNLLVVSLVLAVISFGLNLYFYHVDPVADFFSPQTRFWELLCGAMLAWVSLHPAQLTLKPGLFFRDTAAGTTPDIYTRFSRYRHILSGAGALLLVLSVFLIHVTTTRNYPGIWAAFPVLATMLLIAAGKDGWFNKRVLSNRVMVWFGLISYPLYLWHWPLLAMARLVLRQEPSYLMRVVLLAICILLAWPTTRFIENPLRFGRFPKIKTCLLFAVMIVIGVSGYFIWANNGFMSRFPKAVYAVLSVQEKGFRSGRSFSNGCYSEADANLTFRHCPHTIRHPDKPTIAVWGDSHAANLVTGLETYLGNRFNIWQRSIGQCPPVPNQPKPACNAANERILATILQNRPEKVLLSGNWYSHRKNKLGDLGKTIAELKQHGIDDITVIGPFPVWKQKLPTELVLSYMKTREFPKRIKLKQIMELDKKMASMSKAWQVRYISIVDLLCTDEGCLTMDTDGNVLAFDRGHLSDAGSVFLGRLLKDDPAFMTKPH